MKREFLKDLGIEDKELINKILDENSADIGRAKGDVDDLKSQISQLQSQLDKKTTEYDNLKESTKDYNSLNEKINKLDLDKSTLATEKAQLQVDLDAKVSEILKSHAIENSVRDANAKNIKAVMALLDMEKIKYEDNQLEGISEQLETLKNGEDTSFLFGTESQKLPSGIKLTNPPGGDGGKPTTSKTFAEAVASAIHAKN